MGQPPDLTNRKLGEYRCEARIASGGFGTIWKARGDSRETVIVKIMNPAAASSRKNRAMLQKEYRLCQEFDHPGLLHYLDIGEFRKLPYLVMEYFPSVTLKSALQGEIQGQLMGEAKNILMRICQAVAYVHERNILHCDLKPENILMNRDQEIKLIDFSAALTGWATWMPFGRQSTGTPSYMAPEQIQRHGLSKATDIYGLGAVFYEFFSGHPPFVGDNQQEILQQHLNKLPKPLTRLNKDLTNDIDKLIGSMLAKHPADRPGDMETVLFRLDKLQIYCN